MKRSLPPMDFSDEAGAALREGRPVVALESTIISHGMPYPENLATARRAEEAVRREGAVPATTAIVEGRIKIGISPRELETLATAKGILKASRRDLPAVLSRKMTSATTVAATMILADLAGIRVFASGGIGGVHRGAAETFDISADLPELARTCVAVVSSGVKSILDIGLTLEYLETQGVPVVGYGTDEFPSFYTRESGYGVDCRLNTPGECAELLAAKWGAGLAGGVLIANPAPAEYAMKRVDVERAVAEAVAEAERAGIRGKALTPFLLARIKDLTGGESLAANVELAVGNASLAARIAVELAALGW